MSTRPHPTFLDYVITAINPVLIIGLIGSLVFFLAEVFYQGQYSGRLHLVLGCFVVAAVLITRIALESDTTRAMVFAVPLAGVTILALSRFVQFSGVLAPLSLGINIGLMALVWWVAHRLTWDCTAYDEKEAALGRGLLEAAGLEPSRSTPRLQPPTPVAERSADPSSDSAHEESEPGKHLHSNLRQKKAHHPPGVWIVYVSLAAVPLFGIGELAADRSGARRSWLFTLLVVYVACGLTLLMTTSFLNLRRYLRYRQIEMSPALSAQWIGWGVGLIALILLVTLLLPLPGHTTIRLDLPTVAYSPWTTSNPWATGNEGAKEDRGGPVVLEPEQSHSSPTVAATSSESNPPDQPATNPSLQSQRNLPDQPESSPRDQSPSYPSDQPATDPLDQPSRNLSDQSTSNPPGQAGGLSQHQTPETARRADESLDPSTRGREGRDHAPSNRDSPAGKDAPTTHGSQAERPTRSHSPNVSPQTHAQTPEATPPKSDTSQSEAGKRPSSAEGKSASPRADRPAESSQASSTRHVEPPASGRPAWTPPSFGELAATTFQIFQFLLWLALAIFGLYFLLKNWQHVAAFLSSLWEQLKNLFAPKSKSVKPDQQLEPAATARKLRFVDFSDPFRSGRWTRMRPRELLGYTFSALEAWAHENGQARKSHETPQEFIRRLGESDIPYRPLFARFAEQYCAAAYAPGPPAIQELEWLRTLWLALAQAQARMPPPLQ